MRFLTGALVLLLTACWLLPAQSSVPKVVSRKKAVDPPDPPATVNSAALAPSTERLTYDIEWRLIHAGTAVAESHSQRAQIKLESAGLVSTLFKIDDTYTVNFDDLFCATSSALDSFEGKRHHDTRVTFNRAQNRAEFLERDLLKNSVIRTAEVGIPNCVHDVLSALLDLRGMSVDVGKSVQIPVSDGRRTAPVKIEAQEREEVKAAGATSRTIRYEVNLLNGVVYPRKGRLFLWLTEDSRHLPVQIQLRLPFPVGTVTLRLQKEEHS